jgi:pimeloyl-ACP methyl ester carboxylesterase
MVVYGALALVCGVTLGYFSVHLPKDPVRQEVQFRARVQRQFHARVQDVTLKASDNATLKAWFVQPQHPNGKTVILLHGIMSNRVSIAGYGDMFLQHGYAVLVPDSREHGESGGKIATYGILERDDVHRWAGWLHQRSPQCVYLLGESMGAAIGLQATEVTPELCAVAVESPYATFRQVSYERLGQASGLGTTFWKTIGRPVIEVAIAYTKLRYGVYLPDAEPKSAVERSSVPSLLIAGTADKDIPMTNAKELEVKCVDHCALWIVPGADHGGAAVVDKRGFDSRVLAWFAEHDQPSNSLWTAAL